MKIKDIPQTGKLGLTVTWPGRNGLLRRTLVTPRNPRSGAQQVIRQNLATQAAAYDQLSEAQQQAWISAAAQIQSRPSLGQSGPLTGFQLFTKKDLRLGSQPVSCPQYEYTTNGRAGTAADQAFLQLHTAIVKEASWRGQERGGTPDRTS